jgi:FkbM family methyltransferase
VTQDDGSKSFDPARFQQEVIAETDGQLGRAELHDRDFAALRKWHDHGVRCVLDVGANRGQSFACLRTVLPEALIHCFEANPLYFPVLEEVARRAGGCTVHRYGLGHKSGELTLYVPWAGDKPYLEESSTVLDYYHKPWVAEKFRERGGLRLQEIRVRIRRGDDLELDPEIVKIDVEGAEDAVIRGLASTIKRCRPVLFVENSDWKRVTATVAGMGYEPFRYEAEGDRLVPFYGATTNTFYLRREHRAIAAATRESAG